jgi:hypothetical protein
MVDRVGNDELRLEHAVKLIRHYLEQCAAANMDLLCCRLNLDRRTIAVALKGLVSSGEVEELRPVAARERAESRDACHRALPSHYRLKRTTDRDYLWEQEISVTLPVTRMSEVRESESRLALGTISW